MNKEQQELISKLLKLSQEIDKTPKAKVLS